MTFFTSSAYEPRGVRISRERQEALLAAPKWIGWRVFAVDIHDAIDGLARAVVFSEWIADPKQSRILEFLVDETGERRSPRFDAFLAACGVVERCDDTREIEGRYFAARSDGAAPSDFGPLRLALH